MHPKSPKWLEDIANSCAFIATQMAARELDDYASDLLLRSAVERNFEIIGEALLRIERTDPATAQRISDSRRIIGLRNRLVHGYDVTDHSVVIQIVHRNLPVLQVEVQGLLREAEE
jgi:uncharacterized protein with HEPN domain